MSPLAFLPNIDITTTFVITQILLAAVGAFMLMRYKRMMDGIYNSHLQMIVLNKIALSFISERGLAEDFCKHLHDLGEEALTEGK